MPARPMRKCTCGDQHPCSTLAKERGESKTKTKDEETLGAKAKAVTPPPPGAKKTDLERAKSFVRDLIG
jgi:hypothetical protein